MSSLYKEDRISLISRAAIFSSALLVLSNYYYLYFLEFSQGGTSGAGLLALVRVFAVFLLCSQLFRPVLRSSFRLEEILVLAFLIFGLLVILLKTMFSQEGDWMYLNTLMCAIPLLLLRVRENLARFIFFFECCLLVLVLQVVGEFFIYFYGKSLWENKAFIGGLGNPSSFGILCDLLIAYLLFWRKKSFYSFFAFFLLCAGVVMTSSMLPVLLLTFITVAWGMLRSGVKFAILCLSVALLFMVFSDQILSDHLRYKLASMVGVIDGSQADSSASVSVRVKIHKEYLESLGRDVPGFLFYGFSERYYNGVDSQLITYLSSFGLLASGGFWFYAVLSFCRSIFNSSRASIFFVVGIFIFIIAFLFNRILDYYPMALFFFLICMLPSSLDLSSPRNGGIDKGTEKI